MKLVHWAALLVLGGVTLDAVARSRSRRVAATARVPDRAALDHPQAHNEQLHTYQDLLDESLQLTFPASDPICAHAATRCASPCETPANISDWHLHPGSEERSATAE